MFLGAFWTLDVAVGRLVQLPLDQTFRTFYMTGVIYQKKKNVNLSVQKKLAFFSGVKENHNNQIS